MEVRKRRKLGADEYEEDDADDGAVAGSGAESSSSHKDAAAQAKDTKAG